MTVNDNVDATVLASGSSDGLVPYGGSFYVQWAGMVYAACKEHSGAAFNQKVFAGVSALFARYSNWGVIVAGVIIAGVSFAGASSLG